MRRGKVFLALATALITGLGLSLPAFGAEQVQNKRSRGAVFVHSNDPTGNEIVVYRPGPDGSLSEGRSFATGGLGGIAEGAVADPLASQGSLVHDARRSLLFVVNAGSDTISTFRVDGRRLDLIQEISSGGRFPVSIAIHRSLLYVLNAGDDGNVTGFRIRPDGLRPLSGSTRSLGLSNTTPPNFELSPAQVGFSPSGNQLIVTTKGNGTIEVFSVQANGRLSENSVSTPDPGGPFAFLFDPAGQLLVTEVVTGAVTAYQLNADGTLTVVDGPVPNGQTATCWIVTAKGYFYVSNAGSNTISGYENDPSGQLVLTDPSGVAATTGAGPIDMAVSPNESILYLQNGVDQTIQSFAISEDGSLELLETTPGPPQNNGVPFEGIVAI
jgi:6-phosphogluconolactonase (cycloisomerase 2 family)